MSVDQTFPIDSWVSIIAYSSAHLHNTYRPSHISLYSYWLPKLTYHISALSFQEISLL